MLLEFVAYQGLLIAALALAPQFDTSSQLLYKADGVYRCILERLLRWDNVYFVSLAQNSARYEHEYAFSRVWARTVTFFAALLPLSTLSVSDILLAASMLAILCHLVSCYVLQRSSGALNINKSVADLAGKLYIVSPAGIFLTCGYSESAFAALSFVGVLLYYCRHPALAGLFFGFATLLRPNGLIWGIIYVATTLKLLWHGLVVRSRPLDSSTAFLLLGNIVGGALIGAAFLGPQYMAWLELCPGRPWCTERVPLIYKYVQSHYWNNGFLRYWTPNNIPNFAFAFPTLLLLVRSLHVLPFELQLVQGTMVLGAVFFWHVQIITRVASCLPGPYLYVSQLLLNKKFEGRCWVTYFVIWGLVQAVLFGGFLPPA